MINYKFKITTKHFYQVLCCLLFSNVNFAQTNLVLNPSFEQYTNCPINNTTQNGLANCPDIWYKPNQGGAVYWSSCSNGIFNGKGGMPRNICMGYSYQYTRTGECYMAMGYLNSGYHDYIQIQLTDSCTKDKKYYGEYYVSLANPCKYGCNNIGMLFTTNVVYADTPNSGQSLLLANPQILSYGNPIVTDTMGWVKISGIFTAQGGEQYLTLGNFKSQANTQIKNIQPTGYDGSGYYVDDVAVYALDSFCLKADAGKDITIQQGDSAFIGSYTNGIDTLMWFENGTIKRDSTRPGFYVHPSSTTFYVLQQTVNGCYSADTVYVNVLLPLKFINYQVTLSNNQITNIWQTANEINVSYFNIQRSTNGKDFITIGKVKAENKILNNYTFTDDKLPPITDQLTLYYRLQSVDFDGRITYSVIRNVALGIRNGVSVYPNPAKDVVNVVGKNIKEVRIINYLGQQITTGTNLRNDAIIINTKNFNKGLYIVEVILSNGIIKNEKLIVE